MGGGERGWAGGGGGGTMSNVSQFPRVIVIIVAISLALLIVTTLGICIFPTSTTLSIHALSLFPFLILKIAHK
jgi:hypothetical protein